MTEKKPQDPSAESRGKMEPATPDESEAVEKNQRSLEIGSQVDGPEEPEDYGARAGKAPPDGADVETKKEPGAKAPK